MISRKITLKNHDIDFTEKTIYICLVVNFVFFEATKNVNKLKILSVNKQLKIIIYLRLGWSTLLDSSPPDMLARSPTKFLKIYVNTFLIISYHFLISRKYFIPTAIPGDEVADNVVEPEEELPASSLRLSGRGGGVSEIFPINTLNDFFAKVM